MTASAEPRHEMPCPACAELILATAKKCRHCGSWVSEGTDASGAGNASSVAQSSRMVSSTFVATPMTFSSAVSSCFAKYGNSDGRASRSEYWYFVLFNILANFTVGFLSVLLFGAASSAQAAMYWIGVLVFFIPSMTAMVRRFHDTNRSGWNYWWCLTIIGVIPVIIWLCETGTAGDNKYGPPPNA